MKYLQFYIWDPLDIEQFKRRLFDVRPDIIEWLGPEEITFNHRPEFAILKDYKNQFPEVDIRILTAAACPTHRDDNGFLYESFPIYFLLDTIDSFDSDEIKQFVPNKNFRFKLLCLNHNAHNFRCKLIDQIAKNDLFKPLNLITWHNRNVPEDFKFNWFSPRKITLEGDEFYNQRGLYDSSKLIPQYHDTFLAVVPESSVNEIFITEKTAAPILWLKPFIVLGAKGFNAYLKEIGFELFDELFDYSYDLIDDLDQRIEAYLEQVKKVDAMSMEDVDTMYERLMPKLLHNRQRLLDIEKDKRFDLKSVTQWKTVSLDTKDYLVVEHSNRRWRWYGIAKRCGLIT